MLYISDYSRICSAAPQLSLCIYVLVSETCFVHKTKMQRPTFVPADVANLWAGAAFRHISILNSVLDSPTFHMHVERHNCRGEAIEVVSYRVMGYNELGSYRNSVRSV